METLAAEGHTLMKGNLVFNPVGQKCKSGQKPQNIFDHLRPRRLGQGRKPGGPLESGRTINECSLTGNGDSFVSDGVV